MRAFIVLIPALLAVWYSLYRSPSKAFINIYIPCLLLLPILYKLELSGFPDLGFAQAALLPITAVHLMRTRFRNTLHTHILDLLVIGYVAASTYSEYVNTGSYLTQQGGILWITLLADSFTTVLFPYFLAKELILSNHLSVPLSKRIIILLIITLIFSAYQWRFVVNAHIRMFSWFFPDQEFPIPSYRYGLVRISGPFPHPILLGIAFGVAFFLNHWLHNNHFWKRNFFLLPPLPLSKGLIYTGIIIIGLGFTISRAPIISTFMGSLFLGIGYSKHPFWSLGIRGILIMILGTLGLQFILQYADIDPTHAQTEMAGAAAYRLEMLYKYLPLVHENLLWGWGYLTVPEKVGLRSIDNEFLRILLIHGIIAMVFFLSIFIVAMVRLLKRGMSPRCKDVVERSFCMTMLGIYFMLGVSLVTVWMGGQIKPLFFILAGWTQGFLSTKPGVEAVAQLRPLQKPEKTTALLRVCP
jgi:hypothetical protein